MSFLLFLISFVFINQFLCEDITEAEETVSSEGTVKSLSNDCAYNIYNGCTHSRRYSEEDVDLVREWIQDVYNTHAIYKPIRPPCAKLHVRKDWKCMPEEERLEFISVIRQLYRMGVIEWLAEIHSDNWPGVHKMAQNFNWHIQYLIELEKWVQKFNPKLTLPYWGQSVDFAQPERSAIFDYFGTTGNFSTSYCVRDGMYDNLNLVRCMHRQWCNGTVPPFYSPELETVLMQLAQTQTQHFQLNLGNHFIPHLAIGGWYGDHSITTAPYDITFALWHNYIAMIRWKIRLQNSTDYNNLTPPDYSTGKKVNPSTGAIEPANIYDPLLYWSDRRVLETYTYGFGEMCFVYDQMIDPILRIIRGQSYPIPTAVKRLRKALPKPVFEQYFPQFAKGKYGYFYHSMPEVGECNTRCKPMPMFERYGDNPNGKRQGVLFQYDLGLDILPTALEGQELFANVVSDLNKWGYCSPYQTSH